MSLASEIINGEICGACNIPFEKENGYPCLCKQCWTDKHPRKPKTSGWIDSEGLQCCVYDKVEGK